MLLALLLCHGGFVGLCLAMDRHHGELLGGKPSKRRRLLLRVAGWCLLAAALAVLVASSGWAFGLVYWCAVLMFSGLLLVLLLPYQPRLTLLLAALGLLASPLLALLA